jgi:hypothetical protein
LATTYTDTTGGTPLAQPVLTDGFGHAYAYMSDAVLYTIVISHPLFGANPIILTDQAVPGVGGGGSTYTPFSEVPAGAVDGVNTTFTLTYSPVAGSLLYTLNQLPQTPGLNYTITGNVITVAVAPSTGFLPYAYYWH